MKIPKIFLSTICLSLILSIPCFSEEDHDHGHDHESHQKEEHHDEEHEKKEVSSEKEDEYEDDRHIPNQKDEEKEEEHGEHKGHDDHEEEAHEDEDEDHDEEGEVSSNVGPGNAVTEADHEKGFKLSEKALLSLEIKTKEVKPKGSFTLPKDSIVYSKDETGIYRHRNGWFKLIEGHVSKKDSTNVIFRPDNKKEFQSGDQVVINGVPLLRVTELDAFTAEAAGHAH